MIIYIYIYIGVLGYHIMVFCSVLSGDNQQKSFKENLSMII